MQKLTTLQEFTYWLGKLVARLEAQNRGAAPFANMQLATGLRSAEVLEFSRWTFAANGIATVQLAKTEVSREFRISDLPTAWLQAYAVQSQFYQYGYTSYIHDLKQAGISFVFSNDKKATLSHAFRYHKFRQLYDQYGSVADVQALMMHKSAGSTMYYLLDAIHVQDAKPWLG